MSLANDTHGNRAHSFMNFGIRKKILLGFLSIIMLFFMSIIMTYHLLNKTYTIADQFTKELGSNQRILDLQSMFVKHAFITQEISIFNDKRKLSLYSPLNDEIKKAINDIDLKIKETEDNFFSTKWKELKDSFINYQSQSNIMIESIVNNSIKQEEIFNQYKDKILPDVFKLTDMFDNDIKNSKSITEDSGILDMFNFQISSDVNDIINDLEMIRRVVILFFVISLITSIIITIYLSRSIITPVHHAIDIANNIANGNRNIKVYSRRNDEIGKLLTALSSMNKAIKESEDKLDSSAKENKKLYDSIVSAATIFSDHASLVASGDFSKRIDMTTSNLQKGVMTKLGNDLNMMTHNLSAISDKVLKTSKDMISSLESVRGAVDDQSSGASEQASSINEITASISEIEKSALQTMNKAKSLGEIAEKTRKNGQLGLDSIQNSISGIKVVKDKVQAIAQTILELSKQTQQVGEITAVVNNLAQQSKMLALNASIEAAKAGEAGKGFAVVATEVKNLAEQSEQSTTQVQKILENIKISTEKSVMVTEEGTKGVDVGLDLIEHTGQIIQNLNEVIRETAITSQQIEAAVRQETSAIEQITAGMNEINAVTATFVASIKQTTSAMDDLTSISTKLKSSVEIYKI